ncbi:MAG: hypothetical protein JJU05_11470 [Verrucomicrobia bacterium]|nr:hypothetical protein [Verrucomicrobiota bacterium]MCH8528800.1 CRISPR-associated protein Csx3 [Kiritimatiellia bacterium]
MIIDLSKLYASTKTAKLVNLPDYESAVLKQVPPGSRVTLTGPAPVWLYLRLAHTLHGIARTLHYESPVTGSVLIFDHSPD